ncbi:peptidylprolyl isomerase [Sediminibacterium ginsengisoli]|nr:peptidylprolyl isomerase [Sediminibacterium ginsengisoli]
MKKFLACIMMLSCMLHLQAQVPEASVLKLKAPETFKALFKTTKGNFTIEVYRKWSPAGADRLYQLIKTGFYNNNMLFRVQHDYVVQFGIADSKPLNKFWDPKKLPDEPVKASNTKGVISFARGGSNDRSTQLFINMIDNRVLDTVKRQDLRGYTPVARVVAGMDILYRLTNKYGRSTLAIQDSVYKYGNSYLARNFPGLDSIITATLLD